jgi:hypothetical protein
VRRGFVARDSWNRRDRLWLFSYGQDSKPPPTPQAEGAIPSPGETLSSPRFA